MAEIISVFIKRPGEKPYHTNVSNRLEALQKNVGGYIEHVQMGADWGIICNDEGRINGMQYNCVVCGVDFFGPIIFVGDSGDEFCDMPIDFKQFKMVFSELFKDGKEVNNGSNA